MRCWRFTTAAYVSHVTRADFLCSHCSTPVRFFYITGSAFLKLGSRRSYLEKKKPDWMRIRKKRESKLQKKKLSFGTVYYTTQAGGLLFLGMKSQRMTFPTNESYIESYFHAALFILLYILVMWMKSQCVTIEMKPVEQYCGVVLILVLFFLCE